MNFSILQDGKGISLAGVLASVAIISISITALFSALAFFDAKLIESYHTRIAYLEVRKYMDINQYYYAKNPSIENTKIVSDTYEFVVDERNPSFVLDDIEGTVEVLVDPFLSPIYLQASRYDYWSAKYLCSWKEQRDGKYQYVYLQDYFLQKKPIK